MHAHPHDGLTAQQDLFFPRRRILLVSVAPLFGGAEAYLSKLAGIVSRNHDVRAIVADVTLAAFLNRLDIPTENIDRKLSVRRGRYARAGRCLWRVCQDWHPDVVHLNGQAEAHLMPLAVLLAVPTVLVRHTPLAPPLVPHFKKPFVVFEHKMANAIVCVSDAVRKQLASARIPAQQLHTLPNWIESRRIILHLGAGKRSPGRFRLAIVGRLEVLKGVMDLIAAMKQLSNVVLDVIGDGPQRAQLEAAAKGLPVCFHGFQQDCTPFYDAADLLVFPSHAEGQGQVPLEAMARGTACLVSDIEAALETTDNGRCAAVFHCGDPEDLARQVRALQQNPERLHELRVAGLERVKQVYTEDAVRDRYLALYESVIQEHALRRGRKQRKPWQSNEL